MTAHRQAAGRRPLGELLLEEGWAAKGDVAQALADQADLEERLASLLVRRGLLDPDHAARALGRQHGVPAALVRHLAARDRSLAGRLTPELAHACSALPLAIARDGSAVVCVRDPDRPDVLAALERAFAKRVTLVVACDHTLAPLVREVYGPPPEAMHDAFDIDVSFGDEAGQGAALLGGGEPGFDAFSALSSGAFTLADLDDERVARDPSQMAPPIGRDLEQPTWVPSGVPAPSRPAAPPPSAPPAPSRTATPLPAPLPLPPPSAPRAASPLPTPPPMPAIARTATPLPSLPPLPRVASLPASPLSATAPMPALVPGSAPAAPPAQAPPPAALAVSCDELCARAAAAMARAPDRDRLLDALFTALTALWSAAVLFTVKDSAALGQRGFGGQLSPQAVETMVVPLQSPSLLRAAWQRRELASGEVAGAVQERLLRQLGGGPAHAAPVEIAGRIAALVLVAAPRHEGATAALVSLAKELGTHLGRLIRATKTAS